MNNILILYGINILIFVLALLWILVPAFYGLPSKPTKPDRIRKALQLVGLKTNEVLYDLGAGDGRVLLIAAKEFGAKAVGIEVAPVQIMFCEDHRSSRAVPALDSSNHCSGARRVPVKTAYRSTTVTDLIDDSYGHLADHQEDLVRLEGEYRRSRLRQEARDTADIGAAVDADVTRL